MTVRKDAQLHATDELVAIVRSDGLPTFPCSTFSRFPLVSPPSPAPLYDRTYLVVRLLPGQNAIFA